MGRSCRFGFEGVLGDYFKPFLIALQREIDRAKAAMGNVEAGYTPDVVAEFKRRGGKGSDSIRTPDVLKGKKSGGADAEKDALIEKALED